jgi:2-C-methyl-D-erythritol 2,4-cyclodiphosphate synthase
MRTGLGYDIHRLVTGRALLLGGVRIPSDRGEEGFSDGDVLTHAIIDALLGPAGLGDIGSNFPPGRAELKDISSRELLRRTRVMLEEAGWKVMNIDCVVILETPKVLRYIAEIRACLSADIGVPVDRVTVKGKTAEGLDAVGAGTAVAAQAVALLQEPGA